MLQCERRACEQVRLTGHLKARLKRFDGGNRDIIVPNLDFYLGIFPNLA